MPDHLLIEFFHKAKGVRRLQKQQSLSKSKAIEVSVKTAESELDQLIMRVAKRLEAKSKA